METTVRQSSVHRALRQVQRILSGVLGLFVLGLFVEKIIRHDFGSPLSLLALVGQAWVAGFFVFWSVKGGSPVDRDPDLHQGRVLILLAVMLAIAVFMLLRH